MPFRFKNFSVEDRNSTLRVGTDSMVLGAWADPADAQRILDIGTGCGVLALMMAQKSTGLIDAIEIDPASVDEARSNFRHSKWSDRLSIHEVSLQNFSRKAFGFYDFVICNPPYFSGALKSPSGRKNLARHDEHLTLGELSEAVSGMLMHGGKFAVVLPAEESGRFERIALECSLFPASRMAVHPKPGTPPGRVMTAYRKAIRGSVETADLVIMDRHGRFSPDYLLLTREFHNF